MNGLASVLDDCVIEYSDLSGLRIDFKVDHVGSEGPTRPLWVNGALTGDSAAALGLLIHCVTGGPSSGEGGSATTCHRRVPNGICIRYGGMYILCGNSKDFRGLHGYRSPGSTDVR